MLRRSLNKHILLIFFLARQFSAAATAAIVSSLSTLSSSLQLLCMLCVAPNVIMKHLVFQVKEEEKKTRNLITNSNVI